MDAKWLVINFEPVSLFSLRSTYATSSGGKTLVIPTPYVFKLATIAAAFRLGREEMARKALELIKDRDVRFRPPKYSTVNHTFIKIKREPKTKTWDQPFIPSIAFREFCFFQGELSVAIDVSALDSKSIELLVTLAMHINYFGKQGSFFQFTGVEQVGQIPEQFTLPLPEELGKASPDYQLVQYLDDLGETNSSDLFDRVNTYGGKTIELNKHRILRQFLVPYRVRKESSRYTFYVRGT